MLIAAKCHKITDVRSVEAAQACIREQGAAPGFCFAVYDASAATVTAYVIAEDGDADEAVLVHPVVA